MWDGASVLAVIRDRAGRVRSGTLAGIVGCRAESLRRREMDGDCTRGDLLPAPRGSVCCWK